MAMMPKPARRQGSADNPFPKPPGERGNDQAPGLRFRALGLSNASSIAPGKTRNAGTPSPTPAGAEGSPDAAKAAKAARTPKTGTGKANAPGQRKKTAGLKNARTLTRGYAPKPPTTP